MAKAGSAVRNRCKSISDADLLRLIHFEADPYGQQWEVGPGDKRAGRRGTSIGVVGLRHAAGYEVVLRMDDGSLESFAPMQLFPLARGR